MHVAAPPPAPSSPPLLDVPDVIQAWFRQLLDPELIAQVRSVGDGHVDVTLMAHRGRVRRRPKVTLNAGTDEMVSPGEVR